MYCKLGGYRFDSGIGNCINSSKVYCKYIKERILIIKELVLIVAKCIVNVKLMHLIPHRDFVLIVAKCIVNQ